MTLAKTCHANNMMQDLTSNSTAYCIHESFLNHDVLIFHCCFWKKIESHLES